MSLRFIRHVGICAVLLVVLAQAEVRAEAGDWKADIAALEKRFGISIQYQDYKFPLETVRGKVTGTNPSTKDLKKYVLILKGELFKYPKGVFQKLGVERIVLASNLAFASQSRAAVPELTTMTYFLDVCIGRDVANYQRRVVHHDFFHFIDWSDDYNYDDAEWHALNPADFEYGSGGVNMQDTGEDVFSVRDDMPGFMTKYSTAGVEEDKAEIFSLLMADWRLIEERSKNDDVIAKKVKFVKKLLLAWNSDFDDDFWQRLREGKSPDKPEKEEGDGEKEKPQQEE